MLSGNTIASHTAAPPTEVKETSQLDERCSHQETVDDDEARKYLANATRIAWSSAEERAVLRKIDLIIMPLLFFGAMISYADLQIFGAAALTGMATDLDLMTVSLVDGQLVHDQSRLSFAAGMVFLGAIVFEYPVLFLGQKTSVAKVIAAVKTFTGLCGLLVLTCHGYPQILALRFFTGIASTSQGLFVIYTSMWWKTKEQPLRVGLWVAGSALGSLVGQAGDYGAVGLRGAFAASPWKWIWVIFGSIALAYGLLLAVCLPSTPMTAYFFNEREKTIAVNRLADNKTGIESHQFKWKQVKEAFCDPQVYAFAAFALCIQFANNSLGSFGGFLVTSFGYSTRKALLMVMPASAVAILAMITSGLVVAKGNRNSRLLVACLFLLPSMAGNALLWKAPRNSRGALLVGLYMSVAFYGALVQFLSLLASNIAGHTKKTTANALFAICGSLGGFSGPYSYHGSETDRGYPTAQITVLSLMSLCFVGSIALRAYYGYLNQKNRDFVAAHEESVQESDDAFKDSTDRENPAFHYAR